MSQEWLAQESTWRLGFFAAVFAIMAVLEVASPRRRQLTPKLLRWSGNLGVMLLDALLLRFGFPLLAVGFALMCEQNAWGLFNQLTVPFALVFVLSLLVLDFAIYLQHRGFHAVPALWRLHRMHHADLEFDVTTAVRFHPLEIALSMLVKMAVVLLLGPPALAVMVFEILLNATAMFNHSNVRIPLTFDKVLRWCIVTPDMHRVHHSILRSETNSNFGFNLPWWDHLLGTYRGQPVNGHEGMTIGIELFRTRRDLRLDQMLIQPLRNSSPDNPAERESG